jgi:hypothetical protein
VTLIATTGIDGEDAGLASGLFNTSQQVGGALGLAILSTFAASRTSNVLDGLGQKATSAEHASALVDGFKLAFTIGGGLMAFAAVLGLFLIRRRDVAAINTEAALATG